MLLLKKYFSKYLIALLYRQINKIWKNIPQKKFENLAIDPLQWLLFIILVVFAIDKLNFPTAWSYTIYGHSLNDILDRLGIGIIIISFSWFVMRIIDFIALLLEQKAQLTASKTDDQIIIFVRDFLKIILSVFALLLLIKVCFHQAIGNVLTSLSIVGAALALAARESLENLIASFIIFFDDPFTVGDTVKVNNILGTVERVGLRSTRVRTDDKTLVTVPNKQMVDSIVDNWSMRNMRRAEIKLELSPDTKSDLIQTCIDEIKKLLSYQSDSIVSFSVHLTEINNTASTIVVEYFTAVIANEAFATLKENINFKVKDVLDKNSIALAPGINTITVIK